MKNQAISIAFAVVRLCLAARYFGTASPFVWGFGASEIAACVVTLVNARKATHDTEHAGKLVPFLYLVPLVMTGTGQPSSMIAGLLFCAVTGCIMGVRIYMGLSLTVGAPTFIKAITDGPYSFVRHPLCALEMLAVVMLAACFPSLRNVVALPFVLMSLRATAIIEERFLLGFAEYRGYCDTVRRRFIPFLVALGALGASQSAQADLASVWHNKDGCYACEEYHSTVSYTVTWTGLTPGITVRVRNSAHHEIFSFLPGTASGSTTGSLGVFTIDAATAGHFGAPSTILLDALAVDTEGGGAASGGVSIEGIAIDDNALPTGCSCPYDGHNVPVNLSYTVGPTSETPTPTPPLPKCPWDLDVSMAARCLAGLPSTVYGQLTIIPPSGPIRVTEFSLPPGWVGSHAFYSGNDQTGTAVTIAVGGQTATFTVDCGSNDPPPPNHWTRNYVVGDPCNVSPTPQPTLQPGQTPQPSPGTPPPQPSPPPDGTPPPKSTPAPGGTINVHVSNQDDIYEPVRKAIEEADQGKPQPDFPTDKPEDPDYSDDGEIELLTTEVDEMGANLQAAQATSRHAFDGIKDAWSELPTTFGTTSSISINLPGGYPATLDLSSWSGPINILRSTLKFFLTIAFAVATVRAFSYQH